MHPFVLKSQPGACDICGMDLVRKVEGGNLSGKDLKNVSHVALSPSSRVIANVAVAAAVVKPFSREITCAGLVAYNQERQGKVSAWTAGRLERLMVTSVGSLVRKGTPVAELFSVDLYNAEVQYLLAYKTIKILNSSFSVTFPINTQISLGDAHERLRQLGFREEQFARLNKSSRPAVGIPVYPPFSGVVTEKLVQEGQYVNIGEPLFSIADLSTVWVELEVFESDFPLLSTGQEVAIAAKSYPGQVFQGKVDYIYPFLDPRTRTVRVRVALPNPELKLKPEMFVTGRIMVPLADSLVVPAGAVMVTGNRQMVWVESQPGVFVPREVTMGAKSAGEAQILAGLRAGEKVAVSGAYLIDSEAQLSGGGEVKAQPPPAAGEKDELDMSGMKMKH
jgi:Cu(I)/Ag(I) efflux system membrane fusion protein